MKEYNVSFCWKGMKNILIKLPKVPATHEQVECIVWGSLRKWFEETKTPIPPAVLNVQFDNSKEYQWDYFPLYSPLHILCDVLPDVFGKIDNIVSMLPQECSPEEFLNKFKETYIDEYEKCMRLYNNRDVVGANETTLKHHPDYLIKDAYNLYLLIKETN